jgi:hypothetical protein
MADKKVVITGRVPGMTRDQAQNATTQLGTTVSSSVSTKTDVVVTGSGAGNPMPDIPTVDGLRFDQHRNQITVTRHGDMSHLVTIDDPAKPVLRSSPKPELVRRVRPLAHLLGRRTDQTRGHDHVFLGSH